MYGADWATLRIVGVLNAPLSFSSLRDDVPAEVRLLRHPCRRRGCGTSRRSDSHRRGRRRSSTRSLKNRICAADGAVRHRMRLGRGSWLPRKSHTKSGSSSSSRSCRSAGSSFAYLTQGFAVVVRRRAGDERPLERGDRLADVLDRQRVRAEDLLELATCSPDLFAGRRRRRRACSPSRSGWRSVPPPALPARRRGRPRIAGRSGCGCS